MSACIQERKWPTTRKEKTELLDQLEEGPWPSFVREMKKARESNPTCDDLLGQAPGPGMPGNLSALESGSTGSGGRNISN